MNRIGYNGDIMGIEWNSGGDILEDGVENHRVVICRNYQSLFFEGYRNHRPTEKSDGHRVFEKPGMIHGLQHLHVTTCKNLDGVPSRESDCLPAGT